MVPFIKQVLQDADQILQPSGLFHVHSRLLQSVQDKTLTPQERMEFEAEEQAFRLTIIPEDRKSKSRYTFPQLLWENRELDVKVPEITSETVAHWRGRALDESRPMLRGRYADLVWDLERFVRDDLRRDHQIARVAIESYLEAAADTDTINPIVANTLYDRALDIAACLDEKNLVESIIDAMLNLAERSSPAGVWLHPAKLLLKGRLISPAQRERYRSELENRFSEAALKRDKFVADITFPHLISFYSPKSKLSERQRVLRVYGAMHKSIAEESSPLLAVSCLLPVVELFEENDLPLEADALRFYVEEISPRVEEEMKEISVEQKIDSVEIEEYLAHLIEPNELFMASYRIARQTYPKVTEVRARLDELRQIAPISFLITRISFGSSGLPVSQTGSADDSPDEHFSMQYGQELPWTGLFFQMGWQRLHKKFAFDGESFFTQLQPSPLVLPDRKSFFVNGICAHLDGDYFKAIHLLVPQVENMLRELLRLLRIPRSKGVRGKSGVTELKSMGDVLHDPRVADALDDDLRTFLIHLYIEKRGFNLRNDISHGIAQENVFNEMVSGMVLQSIILLCAIRPEAIFLAEEPPPAGVPHS